MKKVVIESLKTIGFVIYFYAMTFALSLLFDISAGVALLLTLLVVVSVYAVILYVALYQVNAELERLNKKEKARLERERVEFKTQFEENSKHIKEYLDKYAAQ
jgi:membrane protein implicated in regulation of membrane protease activity